MYRFLLVDDEPNILSVLVRALNTTAIDEGGGDRPEVEAFSSATEALQRAGEVPFDLVIFDLQMPEMSGPDFLGRLLLRQPGIGRICLTGDPEHSSVAALTELDSCRVLGKPWRISELRAAIVDSLAGRAARQQR